jgi:hypothetical protein
MDFPLERRARIRAFDADRNPCGLPDQAVKTGIKYVTPRRFRAGNIKIRRAVWFHRGKKNWRLVPKVNNHPACYDPMCNRAGLPYTCVKSFSAGAGS